MAHLSRVASRLDGGIFFALSGLLPTLVRDNPVEARLFGAADAHTTEDEQKVLPAKVTAFPASMPKGFGYSAQLFPSLREFNPNIAHAHGLWAYSSVVSLRLRRQAGTPLVVSPHGMLDAGALAISPLKKKFFGRWFQKAHLQSAAVVHALNAAEARAIRTYGIKSPIAVIPNGVELPRQTAEFSPRPKTPSGRTHSLLFLGRIHPKKGLDALLDAWIPFARDSEPGRRWRLTIAGWDEIGWEKQLRLQLPAGADESVTFAGPLWGEDKSAAYANADAFVLPSRSEGLPMTVLEAWSHQKPVLLTPACHLPEGPAAGAALEVEPTAADLSRGLHTLAMMTDEQRQQMGQAGRLLVERRFTWARVAADLTRVYGSVVGRNPLPPDLAFTEK